MTDDKTREDKNSSSCDSVPNKRHSKSNILKRIVIGKFLDPFGRMMKGIKITFKW